MRKRNFITFHRKVWVFNTTFRPDTIFTFFSTEKSRILCNRVEIFNISKLLVVFILQVGMSSFCQGFISSDDKTFFSNEKKSEKILNVKDWKGRKELRKQIGFSIRHTKTSLRDEESKVGIMYLTQIEQREYLYSASYKIFISIILIDLEFNNIRKYANIWN